MEEWREGNEDLEEKRGRALSLQKCPGRKQMRAPLVKVHAATCEVITLN